MEESGAMAIQISLVAEIDISSLEGNLTSVPKTSDNSVSRNVSQANNQTFINEYYKDIYSTGSYNSKTVETIFASNTKNKKA